ncbi:MAG TPA: peptide ABC transporter substrate-binding protein [Dongiaceae bacterium]|nr:peptide ABC transporter substrate-binding protein [Dongiaceae bacterium]
MNKIIAGLRLPALTVAGLLMTTCLASAETVLNRGNGAEPETLDPDKSTGVPESNIQYELFEGLTTYTADGKVAPGMAEKWDVSDDGLTYTFHLRDAKWSNGDPVTAGDFVYSIQRLVDPATASDYAPIADVIKNAEDIREGKEKDLSKLGMTAVDDHTLKIELAKPTPYLLSMLRHSSFLPVNKKNIEKDGADWTKPGKLVGNGAFTLTAWTPQSSLTVTKNPNYYGASDVKLDKINFYPTEDSSEEFKRYRAGELDVTYEVPADQSKFIQANLKDQYEGKPYLGTYYYIVNLTREPLGKSQDIRTALSMAIDRETLADKVLQGTYLPGYSWVPPGIPDYPTVELSYKGMKQAERVKEAKALLTKAGYGPGHPLKLEILYNTNDNHKKVAIAVQNMWKQIGVDATLTNQEWKVYLDTRDQKQFDVARAAWIGDYGDPMTFADLFLSNAGARNDAGYNSSAYDQAIDASRSERDPAKRMADLAQGEKTLLNDLPIIPLLYYKTKHMISPKVSGWEYNILDFHLGRYMAVK